MPAGITLKDNGILIIQRVKKEDEGLYECQASNAKGLATSSAVITVLGEYQSADSQLLLISYNQYSIQCNCIMDLVLQVSQCQSASSYY